MCHYGDNDGDMPCENIYWCSGRYEQLGIDKFAPGEVTDDDAVCMQCINNGRSSIVA